MLSSGHHSSEVEALLYLWDKAPGVIIKLDYFKSEIFKGFSRMRKNNVIGEDKLLIPQKPFM